MSAWAILVLSVLALGQFALLYWRAFMLGVSEEPVSPRIREAARLAADAPGAADFHAMLGFYNLCPSLEERPQSLVSVRLYYSAMHFLGRAVPALAAWSTREMTACSRFIAVRAGQRAERNAAFHAQVRSW